MAAMFVASMRLIWSASQDLEGASRERARAMIMAFLVGSVAVVDYLPTIGVGAVGPVGFAAILSFIGIAANAIWRYPLVELTPEYAAAQILATIKGAVVVVDLDGRIRVVNQAALTMVGYREGELIGKHIRTIIDPQETISTGQLLRSLGTLDLQMGWRTAAGTRVDVTVTSSFVRDADGSPVGIVYVATDVTERRRADQALRESEHAIERCLNGIRFRCGSTTSRRCESSP